MDEELILYTLALRMAEVRWTRAGDPTPLTNRFKTVSRRVRLFGDVPHPEQPACFQAEWGDNETQVTGMPYKTVLGVNWIIYQCINLDKKAIGTIENNVILNGVRRALAPKPTDQGFSDNRNTLGGLVHHCFISGKIFKDPGDVDGEGMMVVPIKLLVP
jgi:hypothetical protein